MCMQGILIVMYSYDDEQAIRICEKPIKGGTCMCRGRRGQCTRLHLAQERFVLVEQSCMVADCYLASAYQSFPQPIARAFQHHGTCNAARCSDRRRACCHPLGKCWINWSVHSRRSDHEWCSHDVPTAPRSTTTGCPRSTHYSVSSVYPFKLFHEHSARQRCTNTAGNCATDEGGTVENQI